MKYRSAVLAAASGSVGGCCFSRSAQGQYVRRRGLRTNPATPSQTTAKAAFAASIARWRETLTPEQRDAWAAYAAGASTTDALGNARTPSPANAFMRANALRILIGAPTVDTPPTIVQHAIFNFAKAIAAVAASGLVIVDIDANDPWTDETGGYALLFVSAPQNPSLNTYHGSHKLRAVATGAPAGGPSSISYFAPGEFAAGQRLFTRCIAIDASGNVSRPITSTIVAT